MFFVNNTVLLKINEPQTHKPPRLCFLQINCIHCCEAAAIGCPSQLKKTCSWVCLWMKRLWQNFFKTVCPALSVFWFAVCTARLSYLYLYLYLYVSQVRRRPPAFTRSYCFLSSNTNGRGSFSPLLRGKLGRFFSGDCWHFKPPPPPPPLGLLGWMNAESWMTGASFCVLSVWRKRDPPPSW